LLAEARRKAASRGLAIRFEEADAEQAAVCQWQLRPRRQPACVVDIAAPEAAIDEWSACCGLVGA